MSEAATYSLKHVRKGAAFKAEDIPKLPPLAMKRMLAILREHGVNPTAKLDKSNPAVVAALNDVAVAMVALTARRMDARATEAAITEDEDMEEVLRVFDAVKRRNPLFFPTDANVPDLGEGDGADPT